MNCPMCNSTTRAWHRISLPLADESWRMFDNLLSIKAAAVLCKDCKFIELYSSTAPILEPIAEAKISPS